MSGNQALNVNSVVGDHAALEITTRGSDWYFTVCALMVVSTLAFVGLSFTKPQEARLFHYITAGITLVASIAYFSMGANLGQVPIQVEFVRPDSAWVSGAGTREIFYVRYIDWAITTPLLIADLLLTAGTPLPTIWMTILADEVMIVTGLVGALTSTSYKWGYWVFGMLAFFYVVYNIAIDGRRHAGALGGAVSRTFNMCGVLTIFLWFLYPIAWGLSEGGNVIHPDSEAIFYGILDLFAKPVFGFMLIFGHKNINPADIGLHIRQPDHTAREKGWNGAHGTHGGQRAPLDAPLASNANTTAAPGTTTVTSTGATHTGSSAV